MLKKVFFIALLSIPAVLFAQTDLKKTAESLRETKKAGKERCEAIIENILFYGLDIVPYLIEEITDTMKTAPDTLWMVAGKFTVGDLALCTLCEIVRVPLFDVAGVLPGEGNDYYRSIWKELHDSRQNRSEFRDELRLWYENNSALLEYMEYDGKYHAPKKEEYEPCEEDIIVDLLLYDVDRFSRVKYLDIERFARFHKNYLNPFEWDRYTYPVKPEEESHLKQILLEMQEYYEANKESDTWNPEAPVLGQRRFSKFKMIPPKDYSYYMFGTETIPAGTIYRISKPLYDKSGQYALVTLSWLPAMGGHGVGSFTYILKKGYRGWEVYKTGTQIIS